MQKVRRRVLNSIVTRFLESSIVVRRRISSFMISPSSPQTLCTSLTTCDSSIFVGKKSPRYAKISRTPLVASAYCPEMPKKLGHQSTRLEGVVK